MPSDGAAFHYDWTGEGVTLSLRQGGTALPLKDWAQRRPAASRVASRLGMQAEDSVLALSTETFCGLNDYDAVQLGLPQTMEAFVHLHGQGRIDSPRWRLALALEPLQHAQPWTVYRREGPLLFVGERRFRLNRYQLAAMELAGQLDASGADIAARLRLYPDLLNLLAAPASARLRGTGSLVHLTLQSITEAQGRVLFVREGDFLRRYRAGDGWAMTPRRHYFLENA
jgi:hypothetical protein